MQVIINDIDKTYKDGSSIYNKGSHYAYNIDKTADDIIINLSQAQQHAEFNKCSVEHVLIQHIAHETIHKILHNEINEKASLDFDNIASRRAYAKCGTIALNKWFSGFYEGV